MNILKHLIKSRQNFIRNFVKNGNYTKVAVKCLLPIVYLKEKYDQTENPNQFEIIMQDLSRRVISGFDDSKSAMLKLVLIANENLYATCENYQDCLEKEIEILNKGMSVDPLSEYWDKLVKARVETSDLKCELLKYQSLVPCVEMIVNNLNTCYGLFDGHNVSDPERFSEEIQLIQYLIEEKIELLQKLEKQLVELNSLYIAKIH